MSSLAGRRTPTPAPTSAGTTTPARSVPSGAPGAESYGAAGNTGCRITRPATAPCNNTSPSPSRASGVHVGPSSGGAVSPGSHQHVAGELDLRSSGHSRQRLRRAAGGRARRRSGGARRRRAAVRRLCRPGRPMDPRRARSSVEKGATGMTATQTCPVPTAAAARAGVQDADPDSRTSSRSSFTSWTVTGRRSRFGVAQGMSSRSSWSLTARP